ncbi:MAG: hypothetical protein JW850_15340 [Thermoflexales bacterium]|nr:hypothetical protein [Thermoflexales bacterium]
MEKKLAQLPTTEQKLSSLIHMIFAEARKWLKGNDAFEFRYKYEIAELAFRDAYSELLKQLLQQEIEAGEFSPDPQDLTVHLIQGMISESMHLVTANPFLLPTFPSPTARTTRRPGRVPAAPCPPW